MKATGSEKANCKSFGEYSVTAKGLSLTKIMANLIWFLFTVVYVQQVHSQQTYNIKPFGPKMCGELCKRLGNCDSPVYVDKYLTCFLWNTTADALQNSYRTICSKLGGDVNVSTLNKQDNSGKINLFIF